MSSRILSSPIVTTKIKQTARRMRLIRKKLSENGLSSQEIQTIILQKILKVPNPTDSNLIQSQELSQVDNRLATAIYTYLGQITKTQTDAILILDEFIFLLDTESLNLDLDIMQTSSQESIADDKTIKPNLQQQMQLFKAISTLKDKLSIRFNDSDFSFINALKMLKNPFNSFV